MKILYIITKQDVGGAQKYVYDLAENIDQEKFETSVLTGGKGGIRFLSNAFRPYILFLNDWLALMELFFIFKKEKPDVVHLNSSKAGVIGALAAWLIKLTTNNQQLKTIFTAHGWVFNPDNDLSWPLRKFYILLHKFAARFQDRIINVSEYDRKLAIRHKIAPPEKLVTVRNGLDIKRALFLNKTAARKKLTKMIDCRAPTQVEARNDMSDAWIGSIGRLVKEKNYETFVRSAVLIKDPNIKFFIIGDGYEKKKLRALINNLNLQDKFFIIGNLAPAAPYLKAFDIFVLSSIKEGLPYTLLEAMTVGLPIIATRVGGMTEIIDGRGIVILPREPEELARAINHLIQNPAEAEKMSQAACQFAKDNLDLRKMISETEKIYLETV